MRRIVLSTTVFLWAAGACAAQSAAHSDSDPRWSDWPDTDTVFKPTKYGSLDEWKKRREWLRGQVRFAAGLDPEPPRTPLNAKVFGKIEHDDYTIEKAYFESMPGVLVCGNLYRPKNASGKCPAVACPHGHWDKGRITHEERGSIPARCITLARLGAVVFAYDMVGYNDSGKQFEHRAAVWNEPSNALWGFSILGLQTWNSIRVIDFLQSLPDVDPQRIGVTGASGGGTQTFILSAIDDRVSVAAPVNMISSTMQGGCICENAPLLRIGTDNMDIGALFAPKPLLMVSATGDWTKLTPQVEFPMIRHIYELYGAADRVVNVHVDAEHNYNKSSREAMYRFFGKHLLGRPDADSLKEGDIRVDKDEDMLVFAKDAPPANTLTFDEFRQHWKDLCRRQIEAMRPESAESAQKLGDFVRRALGYMVGSRFPKAGEAVRKELSSTTDQLWPCKECVYVRDSRPVRVTEVSSMMASDGRGHRVTIIVPAEGLAVLEGMKTAKAGDGSQTLELIRRRANLSDRVLVVEPFGLRKPATQPAPGRGATKFFTCFNRTDPAEAVYDIVTVLGMVMNEDRTRRVTLVGFGKMGPLCLVARAMVPDEPVEEKNVACIVDMNEFDEGADDAYLKHLDIPGIRRIGGLQAVSAAAATGPMYLFNTGGKFDGTWTQKAGEVHKASVRVEREAVGFEEISTAINKLSEP
ncbi:MAG TPA: acetylxylan esterase [Phycisphaerae bacterium]|nr:acetylxylan esterase [Phycisphaerae bacterium]HRR86159.1 acetylxylan esterase [Phycisphaerae bacterium]